MLHEFSASPHFTRGEEKSSAHWRKYWNSILPQAAVLSFRTDVKLCICRIKKMHPKIQCNHRLFSFSFFQASSSWGHKKERKSQLGFVQSEGTIQGKHFFLLRDFDSLYLVGGANISCFDVLNKESTNSSAIASSGRTRRKLCCWEKQEPATSRSLTHIKSKAVKQKTNRRQWDGT